MSRSADDVGPVNYAERRVLLLASYALPQAASEAVERFFAQPVRVLVAGDLRALGLRGLVRESFARRHRDIVIAVSPGGHDGFGPLLRAVALCLGWPRIYQLGVDNSVRPFSRWRVVAGIGGAFAATLGGVWARIRVDLVRWRIVRSPRGSWTDPRFSWSDQRVLFVRSMFNFGVQAGGSVGHVSGVANAIGRAGAQVTMLSSDIAPMLDPSIQVIRPPAMAHLALPIGLNIPRLQARNISSILREQKSVKPSVIYQRLALGDCTGIELAHRLGVPLIVEYNGSEVWCMKHWGGGRRLGRFYERTEEAMLARADLVVTISEVLRDELVQRGVPASRVVWYPNCIDPTVYDPGRFTMDQRQAVRRRHGIPDDAQVVTFVGTFGDWHGAEIFAKAAAQLLAMRGAEQFHFLFIGDGRRKKLCETILDKALASGRVTFTGLVAQAETPLYLATSDLYVSPHVPNPDGSRFFGSPTKLFEYMAMGKPIVASRLEQVGEVLRHGETAELIEPNEVDALASAIQRVFAMPDKGLSMGTRARAEALGRFTWAAHVLHIATSVRGLS